MKSTYRGDTSNPNDRIEIVNFTKGTNEFPNMTNSLEEREWVKGFKEIYDDTPYGEIPVNFAEDKKEKLISFITSLLHSEIERDRKERKELVTKGIVIERVLTKDGRLEAIDVYDETNKEAVFLEATGRH